MYIIIILITIQADWASLSEIDQDSNLESTKPYSKIEQAIEKFKIIKQFGEIQIHGDCW